MTGGNLFGSIFRLATLDGRHTMEKVNVSRTLGDVKCSCGCTVVQYFVHVCVVFCFSFTAVRMFCPQSMLISTTPVSWWGPGIPGMENKTRLVGLLISIHKCLQYNRCRGHTVCKSAGLFSCSILLYCK